MAKLEKIGPGATVIRMFIRLLMLAALVSWLWHDVQWVGNFYVFTQLSMSFLLAVAVTIALVDPSLPRKRFIYPKWDKVATLVSGTFQLAALAAFGHIALALWLLVVAVSAACVFDN